MTLDISIDRGSRTPLPYQIGHRVIEFIGQGLLPAGARLPSTRALAELLGVARMTVTEAYEWLDETGYVYAKRGSGYYVRAGFDERNPPAVRERSAGPQERAAGPTPAGALDLRPGLPDTQAFPRREWATFVARAARTASAGLYEYGEALGSARLRRALVAYLRRSRGLNPALQQTVVTSGAAQALDLLLRLLPGHSEIVVEDPGPSELQRVPSLHGRPLLRVPVDAEGLQTDLLPRDGRARIVFVIPSHQYPTGVIMSVERRLALLDWAARSDSIVIEDDYDSEFSYRKRPPASLAALDTHNRRVVHVGTFSKTLAPALRLGFMIVPPQFVGPITRIKAWTDRGGATIEQTALAEWIDSGRFERHIHTMRKQYRTKRAALLDALSTRLGDRLRIVGEPAGMHFFALTPSRHPVSQVEKHLADAGLGVRVVDASSLELAGPARRVGLVVGYGNLRVDKADEAAARLSDAILSVA